MNYFIFQKEKNLEIIKENIRMSPCLFSLYARNIIKESGL